MGLLKRRLGLGIRDIRKQRCLTQEQLAEMSDISTDFVSRVERGLNIPSLERINAIAVALNITLSELFLHIDSLETDSCPVHKRERKQHEELREKSEFCGAVRYSIHTEGGGDRIERIRALL